MTAACAECLWLCRTHSHTVAGCKQGKPKINPTSPHSCNGHNKLYSGWTCTKSWSNVHVIWSLIQLLMAWNWIWVCLVFLWPTFSQPLWLNCDRFVESFELCYIKIDFPSLCRYIVLNVSQLCPCGFQMRHHLWLNHILAHHLYLLFALSESAKTVSRQILSHFRKDTLASLSDT